MLDEYCTGCPSEVPPSYIQLENVERTSSYIEDQLNYIRKGGDPMITDQVNLNSWQEKHPEIWSSDEILDWIYYTVSISHIDVTRLKGEQFQGLSGLELCHMDQTEFTRRDPLYGKIFYGCLQNLLNESQFFAPPDFFDLIDRADKFEDIQDCLEHGLPPMGSFLGPMTTDDILNEPNMFHFPSPDSSGYESSFEEPNFTFSDHLSQFGTTNEFFSTIDYSRLPTTVVQAQTSQGRKMSSLQSKPVSARRPGRPRKNRPSSECSSDSESASSPRKRKPHAHKSRTVHLSDFMRDLLDDVTYNPDCIKWENKDEGVFRIVPGRSKVIAELWGKKKNNPSMTFDKLSRSLRWCRQYGFLSEVPKNGRYPKKLCFRFS